MNIVSSYLKERAKWIKFGKPMRSEEEIKEIFDTCITCTQFQKYSENFGICGVCGCHIKREGTFFNKAAWSTTKCPLKDPKWVEKNPIYADFIPTREELEEAEKDHNLDKSKENAPTGGRGCGCSG